MHIMHLRLVSITGKLKNIVSTFDSRGLDNFGLGPVGIPPKFVQKFFFAYRTSKRKLGTCHSCVAMSSERHLQGRVGGGSMKCTRSQIAQEEKMTRQGHSRISFSTINIQIIHAYQELNCRAVILPGAKSEVTWSIASGSVNM
jgi:hypothetical protein